MQEENIITSGIEWFEWVAILGALAWFAPIIIPWMIKKIVKPKLTIISHKIIEIGYSTFGPIINLNLAFLSENKEALIKYISIELQHENEEKHDFEWEWFEESMGEMKVGDTEILPYTKNQKATALRIKKDDIVERKIGFQNFDYSLKYQFLVNKTNEKFNWLQREGKDLNLIKETDSYINLIDHVKNSFFWNIGKYSMAVEVHLLKQVKPFKHTISIELTNYDKKRLESNIDACISSMDNSYIIQDPKFTETWNWVNTLKLNI